MEKTDEQQTAKHFDFDFHRVVGADGALLAGASEHGAWSICAGSRTATAVPAMSITHPAAVPSIIPPLQSFDLFPTRIWQARLSALIPSLAGCVDAVQAMRAANPQPAGRTNRQGWNSEDQAVLDQPVFADVRNAVRAGCASALEQMGVRDVPFQLQSWINMHDRGGFNFLHVHEGSLLSGSFYLKVPPGSGRLVFRDPRPGVVHGYVKGAVPNGYRDIQLAPDAGLLVLFPCWMEHFVEPHNNDDPRIAISFNALPA